MKTIGSLFILMFMLSQQGWAVPEKSVELKLPNGVKMVDVVNKTEIPHPKMTTCTADITLPMFQFDDDKKNTPAMKRFAKHMWETGTDLLKNFLLFSQDADRCGGEFFQSNETSLGYVMTHQFNNGLISMVYNSFSYTGGAHGFGGIEASFIDLSTGDVAENTLDTFFADTEENKDKLLKAMEPKILAKNVENNKWGKFKSGVFGVKDFNKFYFTPEGLVFFWNPYDIADYASGVIEVLFSWDELTGLKKAENKFGAGLP